MGSIGRQWIGVLTLVAVIAMAERLEAQVALRYVDQGATGTNNGQDWTNAYTDLWDALDAIAADENLGNVDIWVAEGEYRPQIVPVIGATFVLRPGIYIYGGFAGGGSGETALLQRNPTDNITILDGRIVYSCPVAFPECGAPGAGDCHTAHLGLGCDDEECCCSVCRFAPQCCDEEWDSTCVGYAEGFCGSTRVERADHVVSRFDADDENLRVPLLSGVTVTGGGNNCELDLSGGGMEVVSDQDVGPVSVDVTRCRFVGNRAGRGGGVEFRTVQGSLNPPVISSVASRFDNCELVDNTVLGTGGGLNVEGYVWYRLTNCLIAGNETTLEGCDPASVHQTGAGIYEQIYLPFPEAEVPERWIINCVLSRNKGGDTPGLEQLPQGVDVGQGLTIANSIIRDNYYLDPNTLEYVLCPLTLNCLGDIDISDAQMHYCIVFAVDGLSPPTTNLSVDPMFVAPDTGDFRLDPESPAIDAGANAYVPFDDLEVDDGEIMDPTQPVPDLDQRRRIVGTGDEDCVVDIGAYEFQSSCEIGDLDQNCAVDGADLGLLLSYWGEDGPTDLDCSGVTDGADLGILLSGWGSTFPFPRNCCEEGLMAGGGEGMMGGVGSDLPGEDSSSLFTLAEVKAILGIDSTAAFVEWVTALPPEEFEFWMSLLGG